MRNLKLILFAAAAFLALACEDETVEPQILVSEASYTIFEKGVTVSSGYSNPKEANGQE